MMPATRAMTVSVLLVLAAGCGGGTGGNDGGGGAGAAGTGGTAGATGAGGAAGTAGAGGAAGSTGAAGTTGTGGTGGVVGVPCGGVNCRADQVCVHPTCGGVQVCDPLGDAGQCPSGWVMTNQCPTSGGPGCIPPACDPPPPKCVDTPAACSGAPMCSCLPADVCTQTNGQSGGSCAFVSEANVVCLSA
jgi:hypothetical protein